MTKPLLLATLLMGMFVAGVGYASKDPKMTASVALGGALALIVGGWLL